jgi:cytochrome c553
MKKWLKRIAMAFVAILVIAVATIYAASELRLRKTYGSVLTAFDAKEFSFVPGEAERRAKTMMCLGCHGEAGKILFEDKLLGRLVTPNLTKVIPEYTDSELERLIRRGIKKDGTAALAMPAATYANLADEDVAAVITFMRGRALLPDKEKAQSEWGPLGRVALALGKITYEADQVKTFKNDKTRPSDVGAYLVGALCNHCHNLDSERDNGFGMKAPPLKAMVQSYTFDEFVTMINSGKGKGDRYMGVMSEVARDEFAYFSDAEKRAIYDYLAKE